MKRGFTLIELLVVVLIIGILAAIALPQYTKSVEKSRFSQAFILVSALGRAQERYVLAAGTPAFTFDDFDVDLPTKAVPGTVTGNLSHKAGGALTDNLFDYVIDSVNSPVWYGTPTVVRNSGNYKGGGFIYSQGRIYCVEGAGSTKQFCKKFYNGTLYLPSQSGWDIYTIPY
ncbi:PilE-like protein [Elusimicrobium minutum Pei191]|uniref:PilE-like protein n=1 Tax=Elusimicrobium minutum (strain Pei191) TaxID=445932 RepID=B2KEN9_ELUMP|nr:prepilin-type N-terminal cleavage/methylation domain-containing protein [Elusimicrobium minutum]ACC98985.1 PilE-like protein [Elusimicrobium minutum Pei191]